MVASTLLRYEFETALQGNLTVERITVFLGLFNLGTNATILLVQTLVERRLLKSFGLFAGLLSVPSVFALCIPLLLFLPGIAVVALIRFAEYAARFSIARTADDLVLLPLSSVKRRRARTLVSGALLPLSVLVTQRATRSPPPSTVYALALPSTAGTCRAEPAGTTTSCATGCARRAVTVTRSSSRPALKMTTLPRPPRDRPAAGSSHSRAVVGAPLVRATPGSRAGSGGR